MVVAVGKRGCGGEVTVAVMEWARIGSRSKLEHKLRPQESQLGFWWWGVRPHGIFELCKLSREQQPLLDRLPVPFTGLSIFVGHISLPLPKVKMIDLLEVRLPSRRSTVHKLADVLGYCAKAGLHRLRWFRRRGMFSVASLNTKDL